MDINMQSLKNLFSFPFQDPRWKDKFLVGSLLSFATMVVPLISWLPLMGYGARLVRAGASHTDAAVLPEWDDWGELFIDGLRMFGAVIILTLPATVLLIGGWLFYMLGIIGSTGSAEQYGGDLNAGFLFFSMIILFVSLAGGMVLSLVGGLLSLPAQAHIAVQKRFDAFFDVGQWLKILRANLGGYIITLFVIFGIYFLLIMAMQLLYITIILCLFIPFLMAPVTFYMTLIYYRLAGQAYGDGVAKLQPSIPVDATPTALSPDAV